MKGYFPVAENIESLEYDSEICVNFGRELDHQKLYMLLSWYLSSEVNMLLIIEKQTHNYLLTSISIATNWCMCEPFTIVITIWEERV